MDPEIIKNIMKTSSLTYWKLKNKLLLFYDKGLQVKVLQYKTAC